MNNFKLIISPKLKPLFIFISILLLSFALFVGGLAPYYLLYIFALTLTLPLTHNLIILKNIKGVVKIPTGALYTGDKIDIEYKIENKSKFPIPYIEISSHITRLLTGRDVEQVIISLDSKSSFLKKVTITLNKRGYYDLGEIHLVIRDVFNFYSFEKGISSDASLLVYPDIICLSTLKITANYKSGELLSTNSLYQDINNMDSLRDYREGDPIKAIHWKLTARNDKVIVKTFENRVDTNTVIFLDNEISHFKGDIDKRLEDKSVDIALSIINYCFNQDINLILETHNQSSHIRLETLDGHELKSYLDVLARFNANSIFRIETLISSQIDKFNKGSTIIVISPYLDKSMGAVGIELKSKNLNPLFIIVTDIKNGTGYMDPVIEKRLLQEGIHIYIIDYTTSIKQILEEGNGQSSR